MRILGIDPGSRTTGFGVIDVVGQNRIYVASGCIKTQGGPLPERIKIILDGIAEIIRTYQP
ncbi:MAG: crossover junction endodeoxyribonuclease RuvC, partial [Deefgea sp.]